MTNVSLNWIDIVLNMLIFDFVLIIFFTFGIFLKQMIYILSLSEKILNIVNLTEPILNILNGFGYVLNICKKVKLNE